MTSVVRAACVRRVQAAEKAPRHPPASQSVVIPRLDRGTQGNVPPCRPARGDLFANGSPRGTRAGAPITRAQQTALREKRSAKALRKQRAPLRGCNLRLFPALAPRDYAP